MQFTAESLPDNIAIIRGDGRLNMVAAPVLRDVILEQITAGRNRVVIDLSTIEFMDSSGLGALIGCLKTARQAGGDLRIAAPTPQVSMVLKLSNLDRVLKAHPAAEGAFDD
jgi:anti-sigma B factor antagonist